MAEQPASAADEPSTLPLANCLEPEPLVAAFQAHPPHDFVALDACGAPAFSARYDLLTTLDDDVRHTLNALPLQPWWRPLLQPYTCFIGTTVSEYCLLPAQGSASEWVEKLKQKLAPRYSFLIIKDLPQQSPLLGTADNARAQAVIDAARKCGFVMVEGQALAYVPIDFASIDDYLARLSKSRRRDLRRKLQSQQQISVETLGSGDSFFSSDAVIDELYGLYTEVFAQSDFHFDKLTRDFFACVLRDADCAGIVMLYRHAGSLIGFNLCFVKDGILIDKYVGFRYPIARELNLYFVSWFANLDFALKRGLHCYVAGWTDPEVKRALGAQFTFTCHAVHVRNVLLRTLLKPFASLFERDARALQQETTDA